MPIPTFSSSAKQQTTTKLDQTARLVTASLLPQSSITTPALASLAHHCLCSVDSGLILNRSASPLQIRSEVSNAPGIMATLASAARDIPQTSLSRDNLTVVAARSSLATVARPHVLPTPPNSISPALPAHGLKAQLHKARLDPIDSDLDLQDGSDGPDRAFSPPSESSGAITSALLAKHYLPDILVNHGPLAIRHIMGYLTASVPGFINIPPTKARRLVVGALEGRAGDHGKEDGEVQYEKVGWGRWDARRRGQAARARQGTPPSSYSTGIPISKRGGRGQDRLRVNVSGSSGGESIVFSHEDCYIPEHDADNMSLDEYESASCSEAPDDDVAMNDDPEDVTDDEDWAAMGAAALRAESYPNMAAAMSDGNRIASTYVPGVARSFAASSGMARPPPTPFTIDMSAFDGPSDAQEREAVEALLRLGSV